MQAKRVVVGWLLALCLCLPFAAAANVELHAPDSVPAGATLDVRWSGDGQAADFIAIVRAGAPEGHYERHAYARTATVRLLVPMPRARTSCASSRPAGRTRRWHAPHSR